MSLHGPSPVSGPSQYLNGRFQTWWYVLNSIGLFGFTLLTESIGAGENRYFVAAISSAVVLWLLIIAGPLFPALVKKFRKSQDKDDKKLAREIVRDYLGVLKMPYAYFLYGAGVLGLWLYAAYPIIVNQYDLYVPKF